MIGRALHKGLLSSRHWAALGSLLSVPFFLFGATPAFAGTLGTLFCNAGANLVPYGRLINVIAYCAGAFFVTSGVLKLKKHGENAANMPLHQVVMTFLGGAACMALPSVGYVVMKSLTGSVSEGGANLCTPGAATDLTTGTADLALIFTNFFSNISPSIEWLTSAVCFIVGAFFVSTGLMRAAKYGTDPRTASVKSITAHILFGAILLSAGQMVDVLLATIFGSSTVQTFSINWAKIDGSSDADFTEVDTAFKAVISFVQVIGVVAFVRGWMILKTGVESGQDIPKGMTHVIGGSLAINIGGVITLLDNTLKTGIITVGS